MLYSHMLAYPPTQLLKSYASTLVFQRQLDLSQVCSLSSFFFMCWFQAIRCGTQGEQLRFSYYAPPCFAALTGNLPSVNSYCSLSPLMYGFPLNTAFLVILSTMNKYHHLFVRALYFYSLQPLWKGWHVSFECVTEPLFSAVYLQLEESVI